MPPTLPMECFYFVRHIVYFLCITKNSYQPSNCCTTLVPSTDDFCEEEHTIGVDTARQGRVVTCRRVNSNCVQSIYRTNLPTVAPLASLKARGRQK